MLFQKIKLYICFAIFISQSEFGVNESQEANSSEQSTDEYSPSERPKRVINKPSSKLSESDESSDYSSQVTKNT